MYTIGLFVPVWCWTVLYYKGIQLFINSIQYVVSWYVWAQEFKPLRTASGNSVLDWTGLNWSITKFSCNTIQFNVTGEQKWSYCTYTTCFLQKPLQHIRSWLPGALSAVEFLFHVKHCDNSLQHGNGSVYISGFATRCCLSSLPNLFRFQTLVYKEP